MSSKVQEYVKRQPSSQGASLEGEFENKDGAQSQLNRMGIQRSISGATNAPLNVKQEGRPSSRQTIADRSRVPTSAYVPQGNGSHPRTALQQSKTPSKITSATRQTSNDRGRATNIRQEVFKSQDLWETDTEHLDDTSNISILTNPADFPVKSEAAPEAKSQLQGHSNQLRVSQAPQKLHGDYSSHAAASPGSERYIETGADHDGDDEYDDASQFTDLQSRGAHHAGNYRPERAAILNHGKGSTDHALLYQAQQRVHRLGQASYPANTSPGLSEMALPGHLRQYSHEFGSVEDASLYNDGPESEDGITGSQELDDRSIMFREMTDDPVHHAQLQVTDSRKVKRKLSPESGFPKSDHGLELPKEPQHLANGHNAFGTPPMPTQHHKLANIKVQEALDYDPKALAKMTYRQLAEESFDTSPQPINLKDPSLKNDASLKEKLLHLNSLDGPREQVQSQRQAFFSSLPIGQYEECGDLMAEQFSEIILKVKQARQQKRSLAKDFEDEIARREKVVEYRKLAVTSDLDRLKRAGQDVVRGK